MGPLHSHTKLFAIFLLLSSALPDPSDDWEFLISQKRHQKKEKIISIPEHIFAESRQVLVWIQVKNPLDLISDITNYDEYDEDNDCLPANIDKETEEQASVNFEASHPNLPNQMQPFSVNINETSKQRRVLCLSHLTPASEKAISFVATVDKPVCRDVTVTLEIGGVDCRENPEEEIKTNDISSYKTAIAFLAVTLAIVAIACGGKQIFDMLQKRTKDAPTEDEEEHRLTSIESGPAGDDNQKSMGGQKRGRSSKKLKKEE